MSDLDEPNGIYGLTALEIHARNVAAYAASHTTRPMTDQPNEPIMQYFAFQHLPVHLQAVSALFYNLATQIIERCPRNPERTVALRKLLESKDAAVRAALATS